MIDGYVREILFDSTLTEQTVYDLLWVGIHWRPGTPMILIRRKYFEEHRELGTLDNGAMYGVVDGDV